MAPAEWLSAVGARIDERGVALERWLGETLAEPAARLVGVSPLKGGAIQENWLVKLEMGGAQQDFVLRKDAPARIRSSLSRAEEFAVLQVVHEAGVTVPRPVAFCSDPSVIGAPFALLERKAGVGLGPRVVKDASLGGDRTALLERLGGELALIHGIKPPVAALDLLGRPPHDPAMAEVQALRRQLDFLGAALPALEWGLRWAEVCAPSASSVTLTHRDFRTGNYMVDQSGLTAILDWEFAGWGDPMADLGWFCAECWRFSRPDLEAGGIGPREPLYRGYEAAGGVIFDEAVRYWETAAHLRWAVVAQEQGARHASGAESSLELALTGRLTAELELAVLRRTAPETWSERRG